MKTIRYGIIMVLLIGSIGVVSAASIIPVITIHSPINTTYHTNNITLNATANEPISTWWYSLDGGSNITFTPPTYLTSLSEGQHCIVVYANDSAGNIGASAYENISVYTAWVKEYPSLNDTSFRAIAVDSANNTIVAGQIRNRNNNDYLVVKYNSSGYVLWYRTYDGGNYDHAYGIATDSADNIIVTGYSYIGGNYDYYTIKYAPNGTVLWNRAYDSGSYDHAYGIATDSADNIIVTGRSRIGGNEDYYTIKYAPNGTVLWNRAYDSGSYDHAYGIATDSADNIIVTGYSYIGGNYDYYTIKYAPNGTILWNRAYDSGSYDYAYGVTTDSADNIIVTGRSRIGGNDDYYTIKYAPNGTVLWNRAYDGGDYDYAYGIATDSNNNVIITGRSRITGGYDYCLYTIKYDQDGDVVWQRPLMSQTGWSESNIIAVDAGNNIYLVDGMIAAKYNSAGSILRVSSFDTATTFHASGYAVDSASNVVVGGTIFNGANFDIMTVKYDSDGTYIWSKTYSTSSNNYFINASSLLIDQSNNIIVIGISTNATNSSILILKYDASGNLLWNKTHEYPNRLGTSSSMLDSYGNILFADSYYNGSSVLRTSKFDSNGNLLWTKTRTSSSWSSMLYGIAIDSANNVIVSDRLCTIKYDANGNVIWTVCHTNWNSEGGIDVDSADNVIVATGSSSDYLTVKYAPNGTALWTKTYNSGSYDDAKDVVVDSADNIIVTGYAYLSGNYDYYTIKYDSSGNVLWGKKYNSGNSDYATDVEADSVGNVIVTGYFYTGSGYDYHTIKYDINGNEIWNTTYSPGGYSYGSTDSIKIDSAGNVYIDGSPSWNNNNYTLIKYSQSSPILCFIVDTTPENAVSGTGAVLGEIVSTSIIVNTHDLEYMIANAGRIYYNSTTGTGYTTDGVSATGIVPYAKVSYANNVTVGIASSINDTLPANASIYLDNDTTPNVNTGTDASQVQIYGNAKNHAKIGYHGPISLNLLADEPIYLFVNPNNATSTVYAGPVNTSITLTAEI